MGDTLFVVGERMNAVQCAYSPISPTGDPLYPFLRGTFASHPWQPGAVPGFAAAPWRGPGEGGEERG